MIGWIGSLLLAICGAPQAWTSYTTKSSAGVSSWFLTLWAVGEVLTLVYVLPTMNIPLLTNYTINLLFIGIIAKYKWGTSEKV